jgi:ATP-dependent RNA helicase DDX21
MSMQAIENSKAVLHNPLDKAPINEGDFDNFPQITQKSKDGLIARGIKYLFPVQIQSFNHVYNRKDLIVRDLTGSGKTLAFGLPMIEYLRKNKFLGTGKIQTMVLAPTRELALQVSKQINDLKHYENEFNLLTVYGGVSIDDQTYQLRKGVDIFVGTTGRVLDHMERRNFDFSHIKTVILDEADQMLKLGFKEDVEKIMAIKDKAAKGLQVLLFSATVPSWVKNMAQEFMSPSFQMIDLAQNLKNKTSRTVNHLAINCPW